ncbi:hypothetical protein [Microbacterium enclense]|uniref:hypothetical protein n=1 Tax=Microbacterium enclense TaxID=993073 RepID=UPI003F7E47FB
MTALDRPVYVHVEGDEIVYVFAGDDSAEREVRYALENEPCDDATVPAAAIL